MVYQQCGPLCPQTCDTNEDECSGGCVEGCFCPSGTVLSYNKCINAADCQGTYHTYTTIDSYTRMKNQKVIWDHTKEYTGTTQHCKYTACVYSRCSWVVSYVCMYTSVQIQVEHFLGDLFHTSRV